MTNITENLNSKDCCKGCFYKKKYHREYMKSWRKKQKNKGQLNLPLQETLQFKSADFKSMIFTNDCIVNGILINTGSKFEILT